jgi:biotin operon repressor
VFADRDGRCFPLQATLAEALGLSRTWVTERLKRLERRGVIRQERRFVAGRQIGSRYTLLDAAPRQGGRAPAFPDSGVTLRDSEQDHVIKDSSLSRPEAVCSDRRAEKTPPPLDWQPSGADLSWAAAHHPDIDLAAHTEHFVASCRANGYRYLDHGAAWRAWMSESAARPPSRRPPTQFREKAAPARTAPADVFAANLAAAAAAGDRIAERRSRIGLFS